MNQLRHFIKIDTSKNRKLFDLGKPMTKEQKEYLEILREKVRKKEISVGKGHNMWNAKYFPDEEKWEE